MFCPNCGKQIASNGEFCSNCGTRIINQQNLSAGSSMTEIFAKQIKSFISPIFDKIKSFISCVFRAAIPALVSFIVCSKSASSLRTQRIGRSHPNASKNLVVIMPLAPFSEVLLVTIRTIDDRLSNSGI